MEVSNLTESRLIAEISKFTDVHQDGSIDITDDIISNIGWLRLLKALQEKNKKYKLQYVIK